MTGKWIDGTKDLQTVTLDGSPIILNNVPVKTNKERNLTTFDIEDMVKAETESIAEKNKLAPKELPVLGLLFADLPYKIKGKGVKVSKGEIKQSLRFHKMLFDFWQRTKDIGYENIYPNHKFHPDAHGPVSSDFKPIVTSLLEKRLITATWGKNGESESVFTLTAKGKEIAEDVWNNTPIEIKKAIETTKDELSLENATAIRDYFHKKYPAYWKKRPEVQEMLAQYTSVEAETN